MFALEYFWGTGKFAIVAALVLLVSVGSLEGGQRCIDSAGNSPCQGTNSPCVCVERADVTPVQGTDVVFDFSESSNPDVTFKTGHNTNAWRVSQVHASNTTPANLGDLFIESTGSTDNYTVEIKNPNVCSGGTCNPGAANLKSAVLKDLTSWTGHSSIAAGSRITGDVTGNLEVVASGSSGGQVDLTIDGDAIGNITVPKVTALTITGDLSSEMRITQRLEGGLTVGGDYCLDRNHRHSRPGRGSFTEH